MKFRDYYKILGVSNKATLAEIKKAYYKLAKELHPDKYIGKTDQEIAEIASKFEEAKEAYEILKNTETRKAFDREYFFYYLGVKDQNNRESTNDRSSRDVKNNHKKHQAKDVNQAQKKSKEQTNASSQEINQDQNKNERRKEESERANHDETSSLNDIYDTVKKQEQKNSFYIRHKKVNKKYNKSFESLSSTIPEQLIFNFGKGTVHVMHEAFYQFSKLRYSNNDSFPKYIIRNRKLVTAACLAVLISGIVSQEDVISQSTVKTVNNENPKYTKEITTGDKEVEYHSIITIDRLHRIKAGDTLSQIAKSSGTSEDELRDINNMSTSQIFIGDYLRIPYYISSENLQYYTKTIKTKSKSIYEIADECETEAKTIYDLNKEAIMNLSGTYIIIADELVVPKFITKEELYNLKNSSNVK